MIVAIILVLVVYTDSILAALPLPPSLKTVEVPLPSNLDEFIKDRAAAIELGKALFWDMQVGSKGTQACATCHYHAGVDNRTKGDFNPGANGTFDIAGANHQFSPDDFPFHRLSDVDDHESTVIHSFDDISGAQGISLIDFIDVNPGSSLDIGLASPDSTFNVAGKNLRRVTGRNAPSTINAIFNFANFHDGRANNLFNGQNPFGAADSSAGIWVNTSGVLAKERVLLENSATASQAVGPPLSDVEMSFRGRTFPKLGKKMLSLTPLGKQLVHSNDSVLGLISAARLHPEDRGLVVGYITMIKSAYRSKYWDSDKILTFDGDGVGTVATHPGRDLTTDEFTHMEANFSFFFGLSIELYESTLVSDETPFDRFREGDDCALTEQQLEGLEIFRNQGSCLNCHFGPEFTGASVNHTLGLVLANLVVFEADPDGDQEVPPVDTPATGIVDMAFNDEDIELDIELGVSNINDPNGLEAITEIHIHLGATGANGPIIFTAFDRTVDGFFDHPLTVTMTPADFDAGSGLANFAAAIQKMRDGDTYINVHTDNHPDGEIRGQITEVPEVEEPIEFMNMAQGSAFYDNGFYNISVTPTSDDIGRGGTDPFGFPLSFSRLGVLKDANDLPDHLAPFVFDLPGVVEIPDQRVAVDGAFKVPGLRNVELTGPYMHNGGMQTLIQVVQFYTRGGNFPDDNIDNLDPDIDEIGHLRDHPDRQNAVVAFLESLTDERVRWEQAPFDHPQLFVAHGSKGDSTQVLGDPDTLGPLGFATSEDFFEVMAVGAQGRSAQGLSPVGRFMESTNIFVIDNRDPLASFTGTWQISSGTNCYGEDSVFSIESGAVATFENPPLASLSGPYTVSIWWTTATNRSTSVTVQVFDGVTLEGAFVVDQSANGGRWNELGSFSFTDKPIVKILSNGNGSVSADAVRFAPASLAELIIDNRDSGASSSGSWQVSGGSDPYGVDSFYSKGTDAKFTFEASLTSRHGVYIRWTAWPSRSSSVPVEIRDGTTLLETVTVDQTSNASIWNALGSFNFSGTAKVIVVSEGSTFSTSADAVRFLKTTGSSHVADHIQITGSMTIADDSTTDYDIVLFYSDGAFETVDATSWSVTDPNASISSAGLLTVDDLNADKTLVISATLTVDDCQLGDTYTVSVVDGGLAAEVIVDNLDAGATSTGTWLTSGGADHYATDSVYSRTTGDMFQFEADLVSGTQYLVYMWWTTWPSRRTNLPVQIFSGSTLLDTVGVNQKKNGGQWNPLGTFTFTDTAKVKITALSGSSTNADAVRFIPLSLVTEIVIDNGLPGTSSTGTWQISGGANPVGDDSVWSRTAGDTFTFEIDASSTYTISAWWTSWPSRSDNVTYEILDGITVLDTVSVDQTTNAGQWNQLGTGSFSFSATPSVRISATGNNTSTNADAIRFVPE